MTLSGSGTCDDANVANNKTVTLGTLALADGTNGGLAANYTLSGGTPVNCESNVLLMRHYPDNMTEQQRSAGSTWQTLMRYKGERLLL